jgi:hypothetical protein
MPIRFNYGKFFMWGYTPYSKIDDPPQIYM